MKEDKITLAVEEYNTKLLNIVSEGMLLGQSKFIVKQRVSDLCKACAIALEELEAPTLLIDQTIEAIKLQFMKSWLMEIRELKKIEKQDQLGLIGETIKTMESNTPIQMTSKGLAIDIPGDDTIGIASGSISNIRDFMTDNGLRSVGAGERYVDYVDKINEALININEKLADGTLTTIGADGRNISVRNLAEINARYQMISEDMQRNNVKQNDFVVASAHADASERCSWWQGKIFLVDLDINSRPMGQYKGVKPNQTVLGHIDGKPYYSLLQACENGFLSFNCQHRLVKYYKGIRPPHYDMLRVKFQRSLTARQRELENRIRKYKRRTALSTKGVRVTRKNPYSGEVEEMSEYKYNQTMSKYWQEQYKIFSDKNGLPEYRWRLRITEYEK